MENNTGFIYRNEKGEFLLRIINRGQFDEDHYVLKFVTAFEWACLFYSEIILDENDRDSLTKIKYRTLLSKEVITDCICEKVVVSGDAYNGFELEVVKMKIRIKAYNGNLPSYLTVGKVYEAHRIQGERCDINLGGGHTIRVSYLTSCVHLNGGSWEVCDE